MKAVAEHFPTFDLVRTRLSAVNYRRIARRCFISLAVVASGSGAVWNYLRCMSTADSMERMGGCLAARLDPGNMTSGEWKWVRWSAVMESKYRTAAWQPWLLLIPDPAEPRL